MAKLSKAPGATARGLIWLLVLSVALSISAYSLYFVARTLGVPKIFAIGFSTAYDGVALIAADKSLQFAQEGKSGAFPRLVMVLFAGLSAFLNSLHAIFGHESHLAIPMWAGLPLAAVAAFEIHTSQARAKAHARNGHGYPAPAPRYGGHSWTLFPLKTLNGLRDVIGARLQALTIVNQAVADRSVLDARETHAALLASPPAVSARRPASERAPDEPADAHAEPHTDAKAGPERPLAGKHHASAPEAHAEAHAEPNAEAHEPHVRPVTAIRTCANAACGRAFKPARSDARYCSGKCRAAASRAARARTEKEA